MAFVNLASFASQWRGYEYYENKKVKSCRQTEDGQYEGMVSGSDGMIYQVKINLEHPRSSQCTCPHAAGKRIVYFTDFIGIASSAIIISRNPVFSTMRPDVFGDLIVEFLVAFGFHRDPDKVPAHKEIHKVFLRHTAVTVHIPDLHKELRLILLQS